MNYLLNMNNFKFKKILMMNYLLYKNKLNNS